MRKSAIAYPNLRAEMSRKNLGVVMMARDLCVNRDTLARKLARKSQITLDEAFDIQIRFFPDLDIKYLFEYPDKKDAS